MAKRLAIANMPESERNEGTGSMFGAVSGTGIETVDNTGCGDSDGFCQASGGVIPISEKPAT
jgi:hypothetical protein